MAAQNVPAADLTEISPSDFSDDELDLPFYLAHFHRIANSVVMEGPNRGFIDIAVWRFPNEVVPGNPRIMENILSLAFFYATDRSWNPYFGHAAVRERLQASLRYWASLQMNNGWFGAPDDGAGVRLAVTSFAVKFMGETLRLLESGPPIDREAYTAAINAQRRAIAALLNPGNTYEHATNFSNHYTNVWGGALAYLDLYPDRELQQHLRRRLTQGLDDFQSAAGYFYEKRGPDWVYEIETHHSNHYMAWHYLRETDLADEYADAIRRWYEWLTYNAVIERDGSGFTMNHSFETRRYFPFYRENRRTMYGETCLPIAEVVTAARAFCESREQRETRLSRQRAELERNWPDVPALAVEAFDSYSPYAFLHRSHFRWHPTTEQKAAARGDLPYLAESSFTHRRTDDREDFTALYVRRPPYYATFASGERLADQQRYGLGLVWRPGYGTVLQSHSGSVDAAWGTHASRSDDIVYEAAMAGVVANVGGSPLPKRGGAADLASSTMSIAYPLGSTGTKTVEFDDDGITVTVRHAGGFVESLPLLVHRGADIQIGDGLAELGPAEARTRITFDSDRTATIQRTNHRVGEKYLSLLQLHATNQLTYRITF